MNEKATVTYADAEMYIVRSGKMWANVVVDEDTGTFMCIGSDGVFAACWPTVPGGGLKRTLLGLSFERFCARCDRQPDDPRAVAFWRDVWPLLMPALGWTGQETRS